MIYPQITTRRLVLRTLALKDAQDLARHFSDIEVVRFMDIGVNEDANEIINYHINSSGCRWGIFLKRENELIGTCGYHCWIESQAEVGFDLSKNYWGNGYMKEAMLPALQFAFTAMKLSIIYANVHIDNLRSQKFMEKLNFTSNMNINNNHRKYTLKRNDFT